MITGFIVGMLCGLFCGWLGLRKLIIQLKVSTEAVRAASLQHVAMTARLNAANAALAFLSRSSGSSGEHLAA